MEWLVFSLVLLANGVAVDSFNSSSVATFGPSGPTVRACPWYKFDGQGQVIYPRGPSEVGNQCRTDVLKYYMDKFRKGESFIVVRAGVELFAHTGGKHDSPNDDDIDEIEVIVEKSQAREGQGASFLRRGARATGSLALPLSQVHVKIDEGDSPPCGIRMGSYGNTTISDTGSKTASYIENDLCLCEADGTETICPKVLYEYGETWWMPLPGCKALSEVLEAYVGRLGLDAFPEWLETWRMNTLQDLLQYDIDKDHRLTLSEVLDIASRRGLNQDWLKLMIQEDPCTIANGQISADFWLQVMENIDSKPGELAQHLKDAGKFPTGKWPSPEASWAPAYEWVYAHLNKTPFEYKADMCRDAIGRAMKGTLQLVARRYL